MKLMLIRVFALLLLVVTPHPGALAADGSDPDRDILVTFDNHDAGNSRAGVGAPYRNRKRYAIAASVRRHARAVEKQYALSRVDHWPIKALSVYCFVYRVADSSERDAVIAELRADTRVESVQGLQEFETSAIANVSYDDTYAKLQHGLTALHITAAHRYSLGDGIRVAIIDSDADIDHEDLIGRISKKVAFTGASRVSDAEHGTAVASIIGATANNARGIVGVAPKSELEVFVSCWRQDVAMNPICDSFTLAKAMDSVLADPPDILNLSLTGPSDALLERLLAKLTGAGVIVIAAEPLHPTERNHFPASLTDVIGVSSSDVRSAQDQSRRLSLHAPGNGILVALPEDAYDMRSGSSLAAAHVSGVVALLLAVLPDAAAKDIRRILYESQTIEIMSAPTINACKALQLADQSRDCRRTTDSLAGQNEKVTLKAPRAFARSGELMKGTE